MPAKPIEYRPSRIHGSVLAAISVLAAGALAWSGIALRPGDEAAMDGFTRILFTAIPVRPFAWTFAGVFAVLALLTLRRTLRDRPTLTISGDGLVISGRAPIPWNGIVAVSVDENEALHIELADEHRGATSPHRRRGLMRRRRDANVVVLSSFELGVEAAAVMAELERRRRP